MVVALNYFIQYLTCISIIEEHFFFLTTSDIPYTIQYYIYLFADTILLFTKFVSIESNTFETILGFKFSLGVRDPRAFVAHHTYTPNFFCFSQSQLHHSPCSPDSKVTSQIL
jgi:hypothetical protein